jgi:hypothetical protein
LYQPLKWADTNIIFLVAAHLRQPTPILENAHECQKF